MLAAPKAPLSASVSEAEWKAMLLRARPGSVIDLGQRRISFARVPFQPSATITIRGGVFGPIVLDRWRNVVFDGARFVGTPGIAGFISLVTAYDPENLTLRNCRFTGYQSASGELQVRGAAIRGGRNVTIERSSFAGLAGFTSFVRTNGVRFVDNDLSNIREGLNISGSSDVVIERNSFQAFQPFGGDHPDAIQFFTNGLTKPGDVGGRDVVIRHNLIQASGHAQGIFTGDELKLANSGRGYERFLIEENVIIGAAWHGITTSDIQDATIRNNRLLKSRDDKMDNRIAVIGGSATVENNEANTYIFRAPVRQARNATTQASGGNRVEAAIFAWKARFRRP
jgi:hypothetical protein